VFSLLINCSQNKTETAAPKAQTADQQVHNATLQNLPQGDGKQLIVYYFMSTYRCPSCIYIEKTTESVVNSVFSNYVKNGRMVFKTINTDEPGNRHYDTDYKLYAQSVILSDIQNGKEVRWTNLDKVWKLLNNDKEFEAYITREIKTYLGES
jgi:thiol-disulfide isomerase/thioredoxin